MEVFYFFCSRQVNYGLGNELLRLLDDRMEKVDASKVQNELFRKWWLNQTKMAKNPSGGVCCL